MSPFDFESNLLFDGIYKIEEGVYIKHYCIEALQKDVMEEKDDINSFGEYESKSLLWQKQINSKADSIALKSIVTTSLRNCAIDQHDLLNICFEMGLFHPEYGSSFDDFISLLKLNTSNNETNTFVVDVITNCNLTELLEFVESRDEVICYVNMMLLYQKEKLNYPGLNADGLVHVTGMCFSNECGDVIIINDTSSDMGAGKKIPLQNFLNAWSKSEYTTIMIALRR